MRNVKKKNDTQTWVFIKKQGKGEDIFFLECVMDCLLGKTHHAWSPAWRPQGTFHKQQLRCVPVLLYDLYVDMLLYGAMIPYICSIADTSGFMIHCCIHAYEMEVNVSDRVTSSLSHSTYFSPSQSLWMPANQQCQVQCSLCSVGRNCSSCMLHGLQWWQKEIWFPPPPVYISNSSKTIYWLIVLVFFVPW